MRRLLLSAFAVTFAFGVWASASSPAEAQYYYRRGDAVAAGIAAAVIGGIVANEVYRRKYRKRYYAYARPRFYAPAY
jgi:hypothetical protein